MLGFQVGREGFELGGSARDEDDVEAFAGELESEFFANAVGGAGDDCPAAFGPELGELQRDVRNPNA